MKKFFSFLLLLSCLFVDALGQEEEEGRDTIMELENIVVSFNKWEQNRNEVPNKIVGIDAREIRLRNPQTAADMLALSGAVFVQKSQLGGGSPMIRGFATNRVLIVADGVRMNNAIYRSGNLQNVISIDPLALEEAEVIFGPGSLIYGSDAIGGVMDFHSLQPGFSKDDRMHAKGSAVARYSTANQERTLHADLNLGWKKFSMLSSVSFSKFDDLRMGSRGGPDSYLRPEYVRRINNTDSIVTNDDPLRQVFSGYEQWNILQKFAYRVNDHVDLQYGFTYAGTGNVPRYDRLTQYRQGKLRFAEWFYGPMIWRMHQLQLNNTRKNWMQDNSRFLLAFQDYDESRNDRARGRNSRFHQAEKVYAYSFNWDAVKATGKSTLYYGIEAVLNRVGSRGTVTDINTGETAAFASRYPDGSSTSAIGLYASYKKNLSEKFTVTTGMRISYNTLSADFDTSFIKFPYGEASINDALPTGSIGLVYRPKKGWQVNANISSGFRMPNIDDIGKLFESAPGLVTVPNPSLRSEYAWNFEAGFAKRSFQHINFEFAAFYTLLTNAIARRPFQFNGQDSIEFGGITSAVEALQNVANARVWGAQAAAEVYLTKKLVWQLNANWIQGRETDDEKDADVPLRHAPPFYGNTNLRYTWKKLTAEFLFFYNGEIAYADMAPSERAKRDIYAKDVDGNPYSPAWHTFSLKLSYKPGRDMMINLGWENITDRRYRTYSSGIVAAGSNLVVSVRKGF